MAEYTPPSDDYYQKEPEVDLGGGTSIDLSDYLKNQDANTLFVSKAQISNYNTKDETHRN